VEGTVPGIVREGSWARDDSGWVDNVGDWTGKTRDAGASSATNSPEKATASNTVDGGIEDSWRQGQCDDDGADGQAGRRAGGVV